MLLGSALQAQGYNTDVHMEVQGSAPWPHASLTEECPLIILSVLRALHHQLLFKGHAGAFVSLPFHPADPGRACDPVYTEIRLE